MLNPTLWLEVLDQFSLYHNYDKRKQTYIDIFENIMLSPAGFNELDGDLNAIFAYEMSWFTSFVSNLSGNSNEEKISSLKNAVTGDFSGDLDAHTWFQRGVKLHDFVDTLQNLREIDKEVGGVGLFFEGLGTVVDIFENTNDAAKKQKVISLLFMARKLSNVKNLCYAFSRASIGNSDPAYVDAWNEFKNDYCGDGGYLQLYTDISEEIKNDLLVTNSGVALEILVNAGVTKYLTSKAIFGATKLGMLKAGIVLWSASEVLDGVQLLSDLDNRMLRDALVSHLFNTIFDNIQQMESRGLRHLGHTRDILSLKRLQSSLMIYIWSDFKAFMDANYSFSIFSGPMAWATYAGIGWSDARDSINQNYIYTIETAKLLYFPSTILSEISALVELAPNVDPRPLALLSETSLSGVVGTQFSLNGDGSHGPKGASITSTWTLSKPPGSSASLSNINSLTPTITPDIPGVYVATLVVSDGAQNSDPASATINVSPEPVDGHDILAHSFRSSNKADAGDRIWFDINLQNSGDYREKAYVEIKVVGPSVDDTLGPYLLGDIDAGQSQPTFNNFASYTFSGSTQDGYYGFYARVFSSPGDEDWSNNYSTHTVAIGIEPEQIKTNAYEYEDMYLDYDDALVLPDQQGGAGGFGWVTYNGYQIAFSKFTNDDETHIYVRKSGVYLESFNDINAQRVYLFDNGNLMVMYNWYNDDRIVFQVGKPNLNGVDIDPIEGVVEVGQELNITFDIGRKGECCINDKIYEYSGRSSWLFEEDDGEYQDQVLNIDPEIENYGWSVDFAPQVAGTHEFVIALDTVDDVDFYVLGKIKAVAPPSDSDSDGVIDPIDAFPTDPAASADNDGDGYPDAWNSGKSQIDSTTGLSLDMNPDDPLVNADTDGDGVADYYDAFDNDPSESYDSDDDGVGDNADAFPADPAASVDSDGDGYPDVWNDGKTQVDSTTSLQLDHPSFINDATEWADSDSDGVGDNADAFPNDIAASIDADGDMRPDAWNTGMTEADSTTGLTLDLFTSNSTEWSDADGDGTGDNSDWAPFDPNESADSDGDGVGDNSDSAPNDASEWEDSDGDGIGNNSDAAPNDPARSTNSSPVLSEIPAFVVYTGVESVVPISISDSDGDVVNLQIVNAPSFLDLVDNELRINAAEGDEGSYEFLIVARDDFSGYATIRTTVTVETAINNDIQVAINGFDEPVELAFEQNSIDISGSATHLSGDLSGVFYRVNEGEWLTAIGTDVWSTKIDNLVVGTTQIDVRAQGSDDSFGAIQSVRLTRLDNGAPSVVVTAPGETVSLVEDEQTVAFEGTASDSDGSIYSVEYRLNGLDWMRAEGTDTWAFSISDIGYGITLVEIRALDNHGGESEIATVGISRSGNTAGWRYPRGDLAATASDNTAYGIPANAFTESWAASQLNTIVYSTSGDIDGDGDLELVVVSGGEVRMYNADGTEAYPAISVPNTSNMRMILDDVDGDGANEILTGTRSSSSLQVNIYKPDGTAVANLSRSGGSDSHMWPVSYLGSNRLLVAYNTGYARDPRGYSVWDISTQTELWYYDLGPCMGDLSVADVDADGDMDFVGSMFTCHNGASGSGIDGTGTTTTDGDLYTILVDENGEEQLVQMLGTETTGGANGGNIHTLVDLENDGTFEIVATVGHSAPYYPGDAQLRILNLDGTVRQQVSVGTNANPRFLVSDLDNNGSKEIVVWSNVDASLSIFDNHLNELQSQTGLGGTYFHGYVASDVDGDGTKEILVRDNEMLKVFDSADLSEKLSFLFDNRITNVWTSDLDGNNTAEIVVTTSDGILHILSGGDEVAGVDSDGDQIEDPMDNCPAIANTSQTDTDNDGQGDACDNDDDNDGILDIDDAYPLVSITGYTDTDSDGAPDDCDQECLVKGMQADTDDDNDGVPDDEDAYPTDPERWLGVLARNDVDGDGQSDLLWRGYQKGWNFLWTMDGTQTDIAAPINVVASQAWDMVGQGDYDGDGKSDIFWRNRNTGHNFIYLMDGHSIKARATLNFVTAPDWEVRGSGDFNGDGKGDVIWRRVNRGDTWLYMMEGLKIGINRPSLWVTDLNFKIVGTGDFDADGDDDVLWRNIATGLNYMWLMQDGQIVNRYTLNTVHSDWIVAGTGDLDGDGVDDILLRNQVDGRNWVYLMEAGQIKTSTLISTVTSQTWQVANMGDYNGDGMSDILWREESTGRNIVHLMNGTSIINRGVLRPVDDTWKVAR
ncbi:FG-GAP-like repeat-containing protein [Alteromonas portus]|uniref:FG-GAP-like repeat-containing protein n=1 Tax=Alteromonas portus TaxID=2565549 RepID=UPI003BF8B765